VTKHHALGLKKVVVPFQDTLRVIVQRSDEEKAGATSVENSKPREKLTFNPPSKELVGAGTKKASRKKNLRLVEKVEVNLADLAKNLFGEDLEELPSEKEDELVKEKASVPEAAQKEDDQQPRLIPRRSGQRIDSGDESEPELQLTAEDEEAALKEAALSTLPKAAE
jgi:hypothetical protein